MGERGRVTDFLGPRSIERTRSRVVYACGPNPMLRAVAEACRGWQLPCQVAVEELMACGLGVCWSCAVPVLAKDGQGWWNMRACVEGPVFNGRASGGSGGSARTESRRRAGESEAARETEDARSG